MSRFIVAILLCAVTLSAFAVVYAKHYNRMLFVELHDLQNERDNLNINWGRLQLEQSTWATHGRIETAARKKLDMRNIDYKEVIIVTP